MVEQSTSSLQLPLLLSVQRETVKTSPMAGIIEFMHLLLTNFFGTSMSEFGRSLTKGTICIEFSLLLGDLPWCLGHNSWWEGDSRTCGGRTEILGTRVSLLRLPSLLGKDNQSLLVRG